MDPKKRTFKMLDELCNYKKNIVGMMKEANAADYYYRTHKHLIKMDQIALLIIRDGKPIYKFSSLDNKDESLLVLIKNDNKLVLVHGNEQIHSYGFETDDEEFNETAMLIYIYNCEVNIIIASNHSEQFTHLVTTYGTNFEATEHFISNIISDLNSNEGGDHDEINFRFELNK